MAANEPKRQHYVPKTYLKNFTSTNKIYMLLKENGRICRRNIAKVAVENDIYTVDTCEDKYYYERYYAQKIEPCLSNLLKIIQQRCESKHSDFNQPIIDSKEKLSLSRHIAIQMMRVPKSQVFINDRYDKLSPEVIERARQYCLFPGSPDEQINQLQEILDRYAPEIKMDVSTDEENIELFSNAIANKHFLFIKIASETILITSDAPIVCYDVETNMARPLNAGPLSPETVIIYPLFPNLMFVAYSPDTLVDAPRSKDCGLKILSRSESERVTHDLNMIQLSHCSICVYSSSADVLISLKNSQIGV